MVYIRKMQKDDIGVLYDIALRSIQPDYKKYGVMKDKKSGMGGFIYEKTIN